jgi:hypothetical protein
LLSERTKSLDVKNGQDPLTMGLQSLWDGVLEEKSSDVV